MVLAISIPASIPANAAETSAQGQAAPQSIYPNQARNAVSLSFDDARVSQADVGLALLSRYQVKATFYLLPVFAKERLPQWREALKNGHEIGNHTLSHLCTGNFQWLREHDAGLEQADLAFIAKDLDESQTFFKQEFGITPKHFAYPCGQTFVGRGKEVKSYVPLIAERFSTGRTWNDETANLPGYTDFAQLRTLPIDNKSFTEIKAMLEAQRETNKWLILAGHDIGSEGTFTTRTTALEQLIQYLQDPANGYWLAPVGQVAEHLQATMPSNATAAASATVSQTSR
nr:polysaccharide deacetylase family protein [Shewanella jiangmenensis]